MRGTLYIVAAPSGAGKSSIVNACLARDGNIRAVDLVHLAQSRAPASAMPSTTISSARTSSGA